jgi:transcription initiation factor TFIIIB Brf1 subunit/transcription initiation factor TFIIB
MHFLHRTSRALSWSERSLREQMLVVDAICDDLSIPKSIKTEICVLYRKAKARKLVMGRDARIVAAALTFLVARSRGLARTEIEVARVLVKRYGMEQRAVVRNIRRTAKFMSQKFELKMRAVSCSDYVARFATQLGLSDRECEAAGRICRAVQPLLRSKSPRLAAAAVLYLSTRGRGDITMQRISDLMGVGLASLSSTVKLFRERLAQV